MLRKLILHMAVLSCIAFSGACDGGIETANVTDSTELNLVISDPDTAPEQLAMLIDFVSYRITCLESGLTPYDDSVDMSGNLDARLDSTPAVWTTVTDLPLSLCTISLWVFYEDEVICSGNRTVRIIDDGDPSTTTKVDIVLECSLSVNPPSGDLDLETSFDLVHGNFCPQLIWLGAIPSVFDPGDPGLARIETYSFDVDETCGQNCDPKVCDFSANPPTCTPGPDNGLTSTLSATAGHGTFGDVHAFDTTFACDPTFPGPTELCVLASDGDVDCDQSRCVTIVCP